MINFYLSIITCAVDFHLQKKGMKPYLLSKYIITVLSNNFNLYATAYKLCVMRQYHVELQFASMLRLPEVLLAY